MSYLDPEEFYVAPSDFPSYFSEEQKEFAVRFINRRIDKIIQKKDVQMLEAEIALGAEGVTSVTS